MKRRLHQITMTAFVLLMIGAGLANLIHAALSGEIRGKRGWISYADHPSWFIFYVAVSAAATLFFSVALWLTWRDHRSFERSMARRPRYDEAQRQGRRPGDGE